MSGGDLLFVYGSLRRASTHPLARCLRGHATHLGEARCAGRLVDLGAYPGLIEGQGEREGGPESEVVGDLFRLATAPDIANADRLWEELDAYEDLSPPAPELPEYVRRLQTCRCPNEEREAWVYAYIGDVGDAPQVPGGDWLEYAARR